MSTTELLTLFDQLCELEPQQRAAELTRISARAPELGKQLQAMLDADAQDTELLARDIEQQAPLQLRQAQHVPADFGQFRMRRELGAGAWAWFGWRTAVWPVPANMPTT